MSIKVAVIGECMIELSEHQTNIVRHFGGDTLNTAVYLTRANPDVSVHYVSALGTDPMSAAMLSQWRQISSTFSSCSRSNRSVFDSCSTVISFWQSFSSFVAKRLSIDHSLRSLVISV